MNNKDPKVDGQKLFSLIFESVMAVLYVCVAYLLLTTQLADHLIKESFRLPLGIILGVYGIFRVYRAFKKLKSRQNETF